MICKFYLTIILVQSYFSFVLNDGISGEKRVENRIPSTDIAEEGDDRLLLFATLDGTLTAIEQQTGKIRWKIKEQPIVQVPLDVPNAILPIFLPDPRDGSLYLLDNSREPLQKLPFSIPQLVSSSPCRSSDGILYTGKKKDIWFKLDPITGNKEQVLGWDDHGTQCPVDSKTSIYIGRTKYDIKMVNGNNPANKWNVTFYVYAAADMSKEELNNYDLVHFTSSSSGRVIILDRRRGSLLWDGDLGSPVVGTYLLDPEGLISVPYTSLANHTIIYLLQQLISHNGLLENSNHMRLYPTLYIGEHVHGLYATRSLVDQNVVTITASDSGPLLLGGPYAPGNPKIYQEHLSGHNYWLPKDFFKEEYPNFESFPMFGEHILVFTG
ncbi:serine/threonine-protein kinase/endoribonuclease ire-1, partial [Anoplophora glabripennis]